jgi:hypothetical protein
VQLLQAAGLGHEGRFSKHILISACQATNDQFWTSTDYVTDHDGGSPHFAGITLAVYEILNHW